MRNRILIWLFTLVAVLTGCRSVHEVPSGDPRVKVNFTIDFEDALPLYTEKEYKTKAQGNYLARHTVAIYRSTGPDRWSDTPDYTSTFYSDEISSQHFQVILEPVLYRVMVFTDYVDGATMSSLCYRPSDFTSIRIPEDIPYTGSNPARDCFTGTRDLDLSRVLESDATVDESLTMTRPVGKYSIVATDKDDFLKMFLVRLRERLLAEGNTTKATETKAEDISLDIFKIKVVYSGFLPDTYNLWRGRPVDARSGVSFNSTLRELESGDLELAFDFVLVNGEEGAVNVAIYIYDDRNEILGTVQTEIPLHTGMRTVLKGKFLTSGAASGISINPGYDGEFNIPL